METAGGLSYHKWFFEANSGPMEAVVQIAIFAFKGDEALEPRLMHLPNPSVDLLQRIPTFGSIRVVGRDAASISNLQQWTYECATSGEMDLIAEESLRCPFDIFL